MFNLVKKKKELWRDWQHNKGRKTAHILTKWFKIQNLTNTKNKKTPPPY